jgi:PAS domain S-box-containing protein
MPNNNFSKETSEKEKRDMYRLAVENAAEHIIITDPDAKIIYANPAATEITGYSREEMVGQTPALWGNNMPKEFYAKMWDTIKNKKKTFSGELNNKKKNGLPYIASLRITPILDDKKNVKYFIGLERDITKEKQIEQMKDDFVNIAAHDLRTPATAVKGFLSMVLEGDAGKVTDPVREMINDAYQGNERLIELINNFLNVSRIERGKIKVIPKPNSIVDIVKAAIQNLEHAAQDKGLYLKYEPQSDLPKVMADSDRTVEVISNLVGNALKFTEKGGITITHELKDNMLITNITDTGPGIAKDVLPELFQKFRRAGTKSNTPGLGLGLYISKLIIVQSHGEIWVKSEEGSGSTFSFSLPIVK